MTLVVEEKMAGGTVADAPMVENYPGLQGATGSEIAQKISSHARAAGVKIKEFEGVENLRVSTEKKIVTTHKAEYEAKAVVIASGSHYRELGIPGEKQFRGRGVSYCGLCEGPFFKGKRVLVVGGGNSALITTLYLAGLAAEVKIAHRRDSFRAEEALVRAIEKKDNVKILWDTEVKEIKGEKLANKTVLLNSKTQMTQELQV